MAVAESENLKEELGNLEQEYETLQKLLIDYAEPFEELEKQVKLAE